MLLAGWLPHSVPSKLTFSYTLGAPALGMVLPTVGSSTRQSSDPLQANLNMSHPSVETQADNEARTSGKQAYESNHRVPSPPSTTAL